jgi:hypothetical protein
VRAGKRRRKTLSGEEIPAALEKYFGIKELSAYERRAEKILLLM